MGHRVLQDALHHVALRALQRRRHVAIAAAWSVRAGVQAIAFRDEVVRARTDAKRAGGILPLRPEWRERRWLVMIEEVDPCQRIIKARRHRGIALGEAMQARLVHQCAELAGRRPLRACDGHA